MLAGVPGRTKWCVQACVFAHAWLASFCMSGTRDTRCARLDSLWCVGYNCAIACHIVKTSECCVHFDWNCSMRFLRIRTHSTFASKHESKIQPSVFNVAVSFIDQLGSDGNSQSAFPVFGSLIWRKNNILDNLIRVFTYNRRSFRSDFAFVAVREPAMAFQFCFHSSMRRTTSIAHWTWPERRRCARQQHLAARTTPECSIITHLCEANGVREGGGSNRKKWTLGRG